jgi:hypothetical protein
MWIIQLYGKQRDLLVPAEENPNKWRELSRIGAAVRANDKAEKNRPRSAMSIPCQPAEAPAEDSFPNRRLNGCWPRQPEPGSH